MYVTVSPISCNICNCIMLSMSQKNVFSLDLKWFFLRVYLAVMGLWIVEGVWELLFPQMNELGLSKISVWVENLSSVNDFTLGVFLKTNCSILILILSV